MTAPRKAPAIVMRRYGGPEELHLEEVDLGPLGPTEVRVRTTYAAVNHTDLRIRAGDWPVRKADPFPYVPGVEVLGVVVETGPGAGRWKLGDRVITMMQGLGGVRAERSGGYQAFVTVDADAVAAVPDLTSESSAGMAAYGLAGVTAYWGLRRMGALDGKRVLVTGASGGVGSAAVSIARAMGAEVHGVVTRSCLVAYARDMGATEVTVAPRGQAPDMPARRFDGVLDTVGGNLFAANVAALRSGGVLSLVGAVAGGDVSFDAWHLITPVTLTGYSTETLDGETLREAVDDIGRWLARGAVRPPGFEVFSLGEASYVHGLLAAPGATGRFLLAP